MPEYTDDRLALLPRNRLELAASDRGVPVWDPEKKSRNTGCGDQVPFFAVGLFDGSTAVLLFEGLGGAPAPACPFRGRSSLRAQGDCRAFARLG